MFSLEQSFKCGFIHVGVIVIFGRYPTENLPSEKLLTKSHKHQERNGIFMEKSKGQLLQEELMIKSKHACELLSDEEIANIDLFNEGYKTFLDKGKTEREVVNYTIQMLEEKGFVPFVAGTNYKAGDKVYLNNRGRALVFATIGTRPLTDGVKILASHIDSPRLDLKPNPLYESKEIAMLKTHYFGGVKKYQWAALPLALHGVVIKKDGTKIEICIGENAGDPVFCFTDLLPHLGKDQMTKPATEVIKGEDMNVLIGSRPFKDDKASDKVKLNIMNMLFERYGMVEADFQSAELILVPVQNAADVGLDRSMVGAYGHDDRVCAYTSIMASLENLNPEYTWVNVLADKEETGSNGATGLQGRYMEYFIHDLAEAAGVTGRSVMSASKCLSADVSCAYDPNYPEVTEPTNTAYLNKGVVITKYTGHRGKGDTNDATAEYMAYVRNFLDEGKVIWQTGLLGKIDQGGGGTVAKFVAEYDIDTVDLGVPVLSMHAPFEVVSKIDTFMAYRAFSEFIKA